jgi:hypothetical protein
MSRAYSLAQEAAASNTLGLFTTRASTETRDAASAMLVRLRALRSSEPALKEPTPKGDELRREDVLRLITSTPP